MPITVVWGNEEQSILHYSLADPWDWEEFYKVTESGRQMREARGAAPASVIIDFTEARKIPSGAMSHFGNMFRRGTAGTNHVQRIVIVKPSGFVLALGQMLLKLYPVAVQKVMFVNSIEEANRTLQETEPLAI